MPKSLVGGLATAILFVATIALFVPRAFSQGYGAAPHFIVPSEDASLGPNPNYYLFFYANLYPLSYDGDTWTGTVTVVRGRQISLAWTNKKGKTKTFTGEVVPAYKVPFYDMANAGKLEMMTVRVSAPGPSFVGKKVSAYFIPETKKVKVGNKKIKVSTNCVFRLVPLAAQKP